MKAMQLTVRRLEDLKTSFLFPHEEMMSQHIETTADVEMHSALIFHRSYCEMSYFSAWV